MAATLKVIIKAASLLLPHGVHVLRHKWLRHADKPKLFSKELAANAALRGRHAGQRCFILGNGPSVKALDLSVLKGETVFSVSNGYLHQGYAVLAPRYHCVPQITYGRMTREDVINWFGEMHRHLGDAELFLNETEAALVKEHGLFAGRKVHYLALRESFDELTSTCLIDISRPVPRVESVPVMALMIAMYLGFREIIILGVDHDSWRTGHYIYAFNTQALANKDISVTSDGKILTPNFDTFHGMARLWRQYRRLAAIAIANDIKIINGGVGGELDEFERRPLDSLISRHES
jgi:hypothetical protein